MTEAEWNDEHADDGGPTYEDLFAFDQIEADRQENAERGTKKPR